MGHHGDPPYALLGVAVFTIGVSAISLIPSAFSQHSLSLYGLIYNKFEGMRVFSPKNISGFNAEKRHSVAVGSEIMRTFGGRKTGTQR